MTKRTIGLVLLSVVVLAPVARAGGGETVDLDQAIAVWLEAATWVEGGPDALTYHACSQISYPSLAGRYPFDAERLAYALEPLNDRLLAAIAALQIRFDATVRLAGIPLTHRQLNVWWQRVALDEVTCLDRETTAALALAVRDAGFVPGDGFGDDAVPLAPTATPQPCTEGRCDCAPCPSELVCGCQSAVRVDGMVDHCAPPRGHCSTSSPRRFSLMTPAPRLLLGTMQ